LIIHQPPADFKLGAGDEIILSLWGETNLREKFIINKDGLIYYENIGFINLSNKTVDEAELLLVNELSKIYSTLKDSESPTNLMIELGKLKSLNIYFSGEIARPGVQLVHPFSDIFVALIQAGGINIEGSLRKIQLIRDNKIIALVDLYSFFNNGVNDFSSLRLIDGDIIHIPVIENRVEIRGAVLRPGFYELLKSEELNNLIKYAAGLTAKASSNVTIDTIKPMIDRMTQDNIISSLNVDLTKDKIFLNNGDRVLIREVGDSSSKVEIFGRVKVPGTYSATKMSLKNIEIFLVDLMTLFLEKQ
jgi:Periplasmic protein involved in polysaccharide export